MLVRIKPTQSIYIAYLGFDLKFDLGFDLGVHSSMVEQVAFNYSVGSSNLPGPNLLFQCSRGNYRGHVA